jgi:hypothetical protein
MSITLNDIRAKRQENKAERERLDQQDRLLEALEATYAAITPTSDDTVNKNTSQVNPVRLTVPHSSSKPTQVESIRNATTLFEDQEFEVSQIESALEQMGQKINTKYPRVRIAMTLHKMVKNGELIRTFEGAGSKPHRYKSIRGQAIRMAGNNA